jgi:hypothetical protein
MAEHPPQDHPTLLPDDALLPDDPPDWLAALMEPWDKWAAEFLERHTLHGDEDLSCYLSWRRAYALMPKSQREWDEREKGDPPEVDHDGMREDQGLRGLPRRLHMLHAVEGHGIPDDTHPLRAMERVLCIELAGLLAFEIPRSWPDEARYEHGSHEAECRGLLLCFALWRQG